MSQRFMTLAPQDVRLPDWGWHYDDPQVTEKLSNSLQRHGQLTPVVVRELPDGAWEVVDGRRRVAVLRTLSAPHVTAYSAGRLSDLDAVRVALDLELRAATDYVRLALQVAALAEASDEPAAVPGRLASTSPWDAARLAHFVQLARWDWSQYRDAPDDQAGFDWLAAEAPDAPPDAPSAYTPPPAALAGPPAPAAEDGAIAGPEPPPEPPRAAKTAEPAEIPPAAPAAAKGRKAAGKAAGKPPRQPELQEPLFWDGPDA